MASTINFIDCMKRRSLATLRTLNVLKILAVRRADNDPPLSPPENIKISIIEITTQNPSKRFIGSPTYFLGPIAKSFIASSTIKIQVNTVLYKSNRSFVVYVFSYLSRAITIVFANTEIVIKFSKNAVRTNIFMLNRIFFRIPVPLDGQILILFKKSVA